jgi:hypothetical protein
VLGPTVHGHVPGGGRTLIGAPGGVTPQQHRVTHGTQPLGHGVDRGRGDHEHAEAEEHHEPEVGQPDPDGGHDRRGDQPAHPPTCGTQGLGAVAGARRALDQRPDPARGCEQDPHADREPTGGGPLIGMTQDAQCRPEQEHGDSDVQGAEGAGHDRGDHSGQPPLHGEPGDGGDNDRQREQQQAQAVPAVGGVEVAGAAPHGAGDCPEDGCEHHPDPGEPAARGSQCAGHRTRLTAGRRLGRGARDRA